MAPNEITICIATHRRPDGLRRLLESICGQSIDQQFDVVVVDNDATGSAKAVTGEFAGRLDLHYLVEPKRGLSRVRNRAVAAATGAYLAFIDDDERASPEWLAELYRTARANAADAVIGPVRFVFQAGVPSHIQGCRLFHESDLPEGETLPWWATRTGNALVRRDALPDRAAPFGHDFDLVGGEDIDLFFRMLDAGAKIVGSSRAVVYEDRPRRRANLGWVLRRALRNGSTSAGVEWRQLGRRDQVARGFREASASVRYAVRAGRLWGRDKARGLDELLNAAEGFGRLSHALGIRIEEYRTHS